MFTRVVSYFSQIVGKWSFARRFQLLNIYATLVGADSFWYLDTYQVRLILSKPQRFPKVSIWGRIESVPLNIAFCFSLVFLRFPGFSFYSWRVSLGFSLWPGIAIYAYWTAVYKCCLHLKVLHESQVDSCLTFYVCRQYRFVYLVVSFIIFCPQTCFFLFVVDTIFNMFNERKTVVTYAFSFSRSVRFLYLQNYDRFDLTDMFRK